MFTWSLDRKVRVTPSHEADLWELFLPTLSAALTLFTAQSHLHISHNMNSQPENSSPVESQKDVIAVQSGSVENQKGAIAIDFVQQKHPSGSQLEIFELQ